MAKGSDTLGATPFPTSEPTIVFDLGGTHFRSGVLAPTGAVVEFSQRPAVNYIDSPDATPSELQEALVSHVLERARRLQMVLGGAAKRAAISIGAPVDGHSGLVLASGPLWGPKAGSLDLRRILAQREPRLSWTVLNDVTAALLRYADSTRSEGLRRLSLATVSTGIALRTYDFERSIVPVDRTTGLQGEVGHLPIVFDVNGSRFHATCDCGGTDHLNAFCSGRGIAKLLPDLAAAFPAEFGGSFLSELCANESKNLDIRCFSRAVAACDPWSIKLLEAFVRPVADVVRALFTMDSEVDRLILVGGVVEGFGAAYSDQLTAQLDATGPYMGSRNRPGFYRERIIDASADRDSALVGAGLHARMLPVDPRDLGRPVWSIDATRTGSYEIREVEWLLDHESASLPGLLGTPDGKAARCLLVIDATVAELYGSQLFACLDSSGVKYSSLVLRVSEREKSLPLVERVVEAMNRFNLDRRGEPIVAVGGGVLLDLVGFACAIFRKGTPYIRIPTTLVGYVDAGIGIKTGVNFAGQKSCLGAYHAPLRTLLYRRFLASLPLRQVRSGAAEILKLALVKDAELLSWLLATGEELVETRFQVGVTADRVLRRAIESMLEELRPNLYEHVLTRPADFGHTFSPWLEMVTGGEVLHGEAVGVDMALSLCIAHGRGLIGSQTAKKGLDAIQRLVGLTHHEALELEGLVVAASSTRRHRGGRLRLPLPSDTCEPVFVDDLSRPELEAALCFLEDRTRHGRPK